MHDLNDAMDDLRAVIPYAHSPSVRKLSKIATLLLAKNYILMQANALEEMRKLVTYLSHSTGVPLPALPGAPPPAPPPGLAHPHPLSLHSPDLPPSPLLPPSSLSSLAFSLSEQPSSTTAVTTAK